MTHKLTIKDKEYLLAECPKNINKFVIKNYGYAGKWLEGIEDSTLNSWKVKIDNENTYKIINTISNLTEEKCKELVDKYTNYETEHEQLLDGMYEDYLEKGNYWVQDSSGIKLWAFKTAKESFISLLKSKNILAKSFVEKIWITEQLVIENTTGYTGQKMFEKWEKQEKEYQNLPDEMLLIQINN